MERFDFDRVIDRRNTNSLKYDFAREMGYPEDALPLWVADMDFTTPPAVTEALHRRVDHGIFGYSDSKEDYAAAVLNWFEARHSWRPKAEWLVKTPGVVFALAMAVRAATEPGEAVLIQTPVYYPFYSVVKNNGRTLVENPLVYENGRYSVDFADFERKITENDVKLFILCSPHNPVGRVWTREELCRMGAICQTHGVTVVSDEIHCDFAFPEHPHTPFPAACPHWAERTIVCTAPSKTFNLAGLQTSNIFLPGKALRSRFKEELSRCGVFGVTVLGMAACQAAYTGGGDWLDQCRVYMRENLDYVREYLATHLPQIRLVEPEGTYFAWLDCSGLGLEPEALEDLVKNQAKLWLDGGAMFGKAAAQFQRVVLACPRSTLEEAMERLRRGCEMTLQLSSDSLTP